MKNTRARTGDGTSSLKLESGHLSIVSARNGNPLDKPHQKRQRGATEWSALPDVSRTRSILSRLFDAIWIFFGEGCHCARTQTCVTYFITFSCYGARLHGGEPGSIDPSHNQPGGRTRPTEPHLERFERSEMKQPHYLLDEPRRAIVLASIIDACQHRGWELLAAHVRESHVHTVVEASCEREKVAHALKAYASQHLNETGIDPPGRKRWTRHASMKRLYSRRDTEDVIRYVALNQGHPMALYVAPERTREKEARQNGARSPPTLNASSNK